MSWVTKSDRLLVVLPDPEQELLHLGAGLAVERAEGLVHQQDLGIVGERAGDRDALHHAAGELLRLGLGGRRRGRSR